MRVAVYPSTEWQMSQPFDCACGKSSHCLGKMDGAHSIQPETLAKYTINEHILQLKRQQVQSDASLSEEQKQHQLKLLQ